MPIEYDLSTVHATSIYADMVVPDGPSPTHIVASCFGYTEMELQLGISQEPVPHIPFSYFWP